MHGQPKSKRDEVFKAPEAAETYIRQVLQRCEDLVETHVWTGLHPQRLESWMTNFEALDEKYLGACVLDALIYRSQEQTRAMMIQLFQRSLPDLCRTKSIGGFSGDWREACSSSADPGIRIVPVIRDIDPPTESGPLVARLLKREIGVNDKWMIWPWQIDQAIARGIRTFLLIDDFLGSGFQFTKFAKRTVRNPDWWQQAVFIYAPLVVFERGAKRVARKFPFLHLTSAEFLDEGHSLFSKESRAFADGQNEPSRAEAFYLAFLGKRGINRWRLGYGRLGLTFAFHHATPNGSIPLLWATGTGLKPLFGR